MTVLVTGSTGLIGSRLVERLLHEGMEVRATLHTRSPVVVDDRIEYVRADLCRREDCHRVVSGVRHVFMLAANTSGAATIRADPMTHVTPNVVMNAQMLEAAHAAGVERFVWLGSTTGYPDTGGRPVHEDEMFEGEPYPAYHFVGWMKRFTEILCRMYSEKLDSGLLTVVLRPTNVYGPNDDFEPQTSHVTAALVRKVVKRQNPIEVWGSGNDVRDVVFVDDVVEAILRSVHLVKRHDAFNIGFGRGYSVLEILRAILELDGYEGAEIVCNPSAATTIPVRLVDVGKAERALGFRPRVGLREGLERTIAWYRATRRCPD